MNKRIGLFLLIIAVCIGAFAGVSYFGGYNGGTALITVKDQVPETDEKKEDNALKINAKGVALIDAYSGKVIYEQNEHEKLPPASVTKVMTMLLVMEAVDRGQASLDDKVTISERAASMGGSQMYMEPGETHSLEELMEGIAIVSANDGCVAVAEFIGGSEEAFVAKMNERAKELGMNDTHFVNTNGLPVADHLTSAYDIAIMSQKLLAYEQPYKWFSTWQKTIKVGLPGKEKEFGLTNTNKLIKQYPGAIGIKTGFTVDAGFCLSGAAERNNTRLIAVVLGCETSKIRFQEIKKLFDYGFANYETQVVAPKGKKLATIKLPKGSPEKLDLVAETDVKASYPKAEKGKITTKIKTLSDLKLPLKKGRKCGTVEVFMDKKKVGEFSLVAGEGARKATLKELYIRIAKTLAAN